MRTRNAVVLISLMIAWVTALLFVVGFGPVTGNSALAAGNTAQLDQADAQLQQLLQLGRQQVTGKLDTVVKWQGEWKTSLQAKPAAERLAAQLALPAAGTENVQGHKVYTSEGLKGAVMGKLSLMEVDGALYVIYRLDAEASAAAKLVQLQHEAGQLLLDNGVAAAWNGSVQGLAPLPGKQAAAASSAGGSSEDTFVMLNHMEKEAGDLQASPIDSFEDGTTVSRTYEVPSFGITTLIGGRKAGLQMAAHTDTVTGQQEVSWGSPMLTIEY
ncbi:hypothetical protein AWM70_14895 [Paenibacillus yonginensis]|uniref:TATA-box binding protein n=1 Tax=Paenibacillus yonginensis TaxID=1462996 RepID=A0A1B1N2S5_9BACL|nr:hypothetical protein [Paenibacillus yonginensis]ANS75727.1 hypothetical protein AWM70_14895 [Paenibacillus yonginensis]